MTKFERAVRELSDLRDFYLKVQKMRGKMTAADDSKHTQSDGRREGLAPESTVGQSAVLVPPGRGESL
jgi:hypothetical protein